MTNCSFCGYEIERGTGKIKILNEGKVVNLCSSKCEKNMFKLRRIPRETEWTAEYKAVKDMRLATDHHKADEKKTESKKEIKFEVKKSEAKMPVKSIIKAEAKNKGSAAASAKK